MRRLKVVLIFLISLATNAHSASFDCSKSTTDTEVAICSSEKISLLDELMAFSYKTNLKTSSSPEQVKLDQKTWRKEVRDSCKSNSSCLIEAYNAKIDLDARLVKKYLSSVRWELKKEDWSGSRFCVHIYAREKRRLVVSYYCAGGEYYDLDF